MRYYGCPCGQCRARGLAGPLLLITVGVLFALDHIWGLWRFSQTWPVILIVLGAVKVVQRLASSAGHGLPPLSPTSSSSSPQGEKTNAP